MRTWCSLVLALASGCVVPRSMVVGQMAAPVGPGATDVGVFGGVLYASQNNPTFVGTDALGDPQNTQERNATFSAPAFEANVQHGFTEQLALNVHASPAGLQPGLKWTLNRSNVAHVALLPAVAFGYASLGGSTFTSGADGVLTEGNPRSQTSFTALGGLKILVSHRSGFFAGVGYDFIFNRNYNSSVIGGAGTMEQRVEIVETTSHQVSASLGVDIALGLVHLRPEVAFAVYPGISQGRRVAVSPNVNESSASGGFGFAIFPGFTLAVSSTARGSSDEEVEERARQEAARKRANRRRALGEDEDDEDDVVDENYRKNELKKKAKLDDDEEEKRLKKKSSRPADEEDE